MVIDTRVLSQVENRGKKEGSPGKSIYYET